MADLETPSAPEPPEDTLTVRRSRAPWVIALLGALAAVGVAVGYFLRSAAELPGAESLSPPAEVPAVDAGPPASISEGDALLKSLAAHWSDQPLFRTWLEGLGLRQLVTAVHLVSEGESPRPALPFITIDAPFSVRELSPATMGKKPNQLPKTKAKTKTQTRTQTRTQRAKKGPPPPPSPEPRAFVASAATQRYDLLTRAFVSIDPQAAATAFFTLRPFCDAAYAEISKPGARFTDAVRGAIHRLVAVRVPEGDIELVAQGALYVFKDPALEGLSPAEKHLLRLGPKNASAVQAWLRAFADRALFDAGL